MTLNQSTKSITPLPLNANIKIELEEENDLPDYQNDINIGKVENRYIKLRSSKKTQKQKCQSPIRVHIENSEQKKEINITEVDLKENFYETINDINQYNSYLEMTDSDRDISEDNCSNCDSDDDHENNKDVFAEKSIIAKQNNNNSQLSIMTIDEQNNDSSPLKEKTTDEQNNDSSPLKEKTTDEQNNNGSQLKEKTTDEENNNSQLNTISSYEQNKKNLLIIGYYSLSDGFSACANYLSNDYNVLFFPLLYYQNNNLNIVSDLAKYINGEPVMNPMLKPNSKKVDIVLVWYHNYFADDWSKLHSFRQIRAKAHLGAKFIGYNWDPVTPLKDMTIKRFNLISKMDTFLSGDNFELKYLRSKGLKNVDYCPSGFDPKISYYTENEAYKCDVSIICTNLYDNYQEWPLECVRLNRKILVDAIYSNRDKIKFHIYGSPFLGKLYPECYKGYIAYGDCPKVFSNSKINLCIHAVSYNSSDNELYFSERLPQILGCKGLLYCETEYKYLLKHGVNYIMADPSDPIKQIMDIIANYNDYREIIENGYQLAMDHFTWDTVRKKIVSFS